LGGAAPKTGLSADSLPGPTFINLLNAELRAAGGVTGRQMQNLGTSADHAFDASQTYFSGLDANVVASVVSAAADLALVLDNQGVIRDISLGANQRQELGEVRHWIGRRWIETVTGETRPKVSAMLGQALASADESSSSPRRDRHVNHPLSGGLELPVSYRVVPMGQQGRVIALGRDLRAAAAVQQRLVDAQQSMERDYLRLRHAEARYRLLFEAVDEAVLVTESTSFAVFEHNAAAARLLGESSKRIVGRPLTDFLAPEHQARAKAGLLQSRASGRSEDLLVKLAAGGAEVRLNSSLFKQDGASLLLVRVVAAAPAGSDLGADNSLLPGSSLMQVVNAMPDAFVLTDMQGQVLSTNAAFTDMIQSSPGESLVGQSLDRWLGRSSVDLNVLIGNLRQHGVLKLFPTTLRSTFGDAIAVEISAVAVPEGVEACLGFYIRDVSRRLPAGGKAERQLPRSADQLTGLVGRLPLKDIVGETTDLIERLCIEAALDLTRDNRASAAEMLGLSRQSLYVKMRRFDIQDMGQSPSVS
jgi:transcriptional regulator PpsR